MAGSDEATTRIHEIVRNDPDWSRLLKLTTNHGILPYLYHSLQDIETEVPEEVYETLRTRCERAALQNLQFAQRLHDIVETFNEHDIRTIPYKGPILAQVAYGDIGRRRFGDLDFLVAEEDVLRARTVLQERGYEQTNFLGVPPSHLVENSIFRWEREFRFTNDDDRIQIELRPQFTGGNQSNAAIFEDLWERRTTVSVAGQPVQALSPEDRALLLLTHGTKHGWLRLSWVCDIACLLQHDIDWEVVLERAEDYGWKTAALLGLGMTAELAHVELPEHVRRELADNYRATRGTSALVTRFERDPTGKRLDLEPWTVILFLNDGIVDSVKELFDVVFAPRYADVELVRLPPSLYPLYYVIRVLKFPSKIVRKGRELLE
ncbi:nucleotidyltransferase domain-containing protein [Halobellus ruber]|uniref:Nucleotidyltransferase family protein n=1 Tax=Halobellus ruber TaxID=2761102 RepID=A0A7J9SJQ4_9EURY|nr:nucleotidyltransferase family protein [Halobellus ruber]MBB6646613.1 nucleotidyltransferase family protein [Halobellus ruber]